MTRLMLCLIATWLVLLSSWQNGAAQDRLSSAVVSPSETERLKGLLHALASPVYREREVATERLKKEPGCFFLLQWAIEEDRELRTSLEAQARLTSLKRYFEERIKAAGLKNLLASESPPLDLLIDQAYHSRDLLKDPKPLIASLRKRIEGIESEAGIATEFPYKDLGRKDLFGHVEIVSGRLTGPWILKGHDFDNRFHSLLVAKGATFHGALSSCIAIMAGGVEIRGNPTCSVLLVNGPITKTPSGDGPTASQCFIFCNGDCFLRGVDSSVLLVNGNVTVEHEVYNSALYATGEIKIGKRTYDSVSRGRLAALPFNPMLEQSDIGLGLSQDSHGLFVETLGKRFARCGLLPGDRIELSTGAGMSALRAKLCGAIVETKEILLPVKRRGEQKTVPIRFLDF
ncbi:MAG: hypothetical protein U0793_25785 [Gemmataceae bacterium]